MSKTSEIKLVQNANETLSEQRDDYYRVNSDSNVIGFDEDTERTTLYHQFDPLGDLTTLLMDTDLIQQSPIDVSFVVTEIVRYVGYIESNLTEPSSRSTFWSSQRDVEQCYFISFSPKSVHSSYFLTTF